MAEPSLDLPALERRRRLSLRAATIALGVAVVGLPLGMEVGGSDRTDTLGGALILAGIAGAIACPWIVRAWQSFMRGRLVAAAVAGRADIRHLDGERQLVDVRGALASDAFNLAAFRDSGLVEPFESAGVHHVLMGTAQGVPFGIAEIALLDAKGYRMFDGGLASFTLAHPRPGLTIVTRDRGLLGNLVAGAGSPIERLPLEDPAFEGVFEVYGADQVAGRVVLTTTMLERLKALDGVTLARGFACAFLENHLLVAFRGMSWRCPSWRILTPVDAWLRDYSARLAALVDLPVDIVHTLDLETPSGDWPAIALTDRVPVTIGSGTGQVFSSPLWRVVGEGGLPLVYVASGAAFGGVALFGAWYGVTQGYSSQLFWYFWALIAAGLAYGTFAIAAGIREIGRLAWRWDAPLRSLKRS
jgi:hypothetical protein